MTTHNTHLPGGERDLCANFLNHSANEYRQTLRLRYKEVPELNPVPSCSQVGELLNYLPGRKKNYSNLEETESGYLCEIGELVDMVTN